MLKIKSFPGDQTDVSAKTKSMPMICTALLDELSEQRFCTAAKSLCVYDSKILHRKTDDSDNVTALNSSKNQKRNNYVD